MPGPFFLQNVALAPVDYLSRTKADPASEVQDWQNDRIILGVSPEALYRVQLCVSIAVSYIRSQGIPADLFPIFKEARVLALEQYQGLSENIWQALHDWIVDATTEPEDEIESED
jgi:hypothetical protein